MIKQGLSIKLGQSLSMTPQLQQAIRLLQLSSVELQQEIQEVLESNPLLEKVGDEISASDEPIQIEAEQSANSTETTENIPDELNMDAEWDDIYDPAWKVKNTASESSSSDFIETMHSNPEGLHDHLLWQVDMSNLSFQDKAIARLIIDYINDDGYLTEDLKQIFDSLSDSLLIDFDEVEAILTFVQHLGPAGIAARNLGECLLLQLNKTAKSHPLHNKAVRLLSKNLDLLEKRDYTSIKRTLGLTPSKLESLMTLIRSFDPKPGKVFSTESADYITPDIYVRKTNGRWRISLNSDIQPELQVNHYYANMLNKENSQVSQTASNSAQQQEATRYIKDNLQQARWFIKSLDNRNHTIVNVAQAIIERQQAFLHYGDEAMKPMVLKDLADQLGLHESTISRVTTHKYMHTPRGIYEFKHFFSSHVSTDTGGECSATAIRAMIKKMIENEDPAKPLSDNKLTNLLKEQGINVARRTVAKYREALTIPSSHDRKVFA